VPSRKDPIALTVFVLSLHVILLELVHTQMLNLKTWNHVVYIVIPLGMLGYGIGANLAWIAKAPLARVDPMLVIRAGALLVAVLSVAVTLALVRLPIELAQLTGLLSGQLGLVAIYSIFILPYVAIGALILFLFGLEPARTARLYFYDLVGAAAGAAIFFALIGRLGPCDTVIWSSASIVVASLSGSVRWLVGLAPILAIAAHFVPEPSRYVVDAAKGIEVIADDQPGVPHVYSQWSALGRTDIFRFDDPEAASDLADRAYATFEIPVTPRPPFAYVTNDYLSGTPIYELTDEVLAASRIIPFAIVMEAPYVLLDRPRTFVIGAGGGRDLWMARLHGAPSIHAAEINPAEFRALAPGGPLNAYNGNQYGQPGTTVVNGDGRHVAKTLPSGQHDLVVLNGVDTFAGLSSGAYAYAESYLYTREAIEDFLRTLDDDGILDYNRWFFPGLERETLRLFGTAFKALRRLGYDDPWNHAIVIHEPTGGTSWSVNLFRKRAYTPAEIARVDAFVRAAGGSLVFPLPDWTTANPPPNVFVAYAQAAVAGNEDLYEAAYAYDITEVTDDRPFFYKYYRLSSFFRNPTDAQHHTGTLPYLTQLVIFVQAFFFIALFLALPLLRWHRGALASLRMGFALPALAYFALVGVGFMLVEIPLMQRCAVVLGSPIHSISVTLATLLLATGVGSLLLSRRHPEGLPAAMAAPLAFAVLVGALLHNGVCRALFDFVAAAPFAVRALTVAATVAPFGLVLGAFFPSGLSRVARVHQDLLAWGWALNCGFGVLGSIAAITLAQGLGFSKVLLLGAVCYLIATLAYRRLA
jgi:hypothetical protein